MSTAATPGAPGIPGTPPRASTAHGDADAAAGAGTPNAGAYPDGNSGAGPTERSTRRGFLRQWFSGWWAVAHLVLDLLAGCLWLVVPIFVIVGVATIPAAGAGLLILLAGLWLAWCVAHVERARAAALLGVEVQAPVSDPHQSWWKKLFLDPVRWREVAGATLLSLWGLIIGTIAVYMISWAASLVVFPTYLPGIEEPRLALPWWRMTGFGIADQPVQLAVLWVAGLLILLFAPLVAPYVARVDAAIVRSFFGESPSQRMRALESRAAALHRSRSATVDSVEAERRRIERDLHDGPQQKLVSVAMDIGLARSALRPVGTPPDTNAALGHLDRAHASAKEAITEMRQVARGIVPPILADRGLDAAFSALAVRSPIPVDVYVDPQIGRLDPAVEAIAYFCASEGLTNVAKHSSARNARVVLVPAADGTRRIVLTIEDDGVGGAVLPDQVPAGSATSGTGLVGLRQRAAAVDGYVTLYSPPGGPTALSVVLPWMPAPGTVGGAR